MCRAIVQPYHGSPSYLRDGRPNVYPFAVLVSVGIGQGIAEFVIVHAAGCDGVSSYFGVDDEVLQAHAFSTAQVDQCRGVGSSCVPFEKNHIEAGRKGSDRDQSEA